MRSTTRSRSTRRTSTAQSLVSKENHGPSQRESSNKKARHRLSTAELVRLEDVFKKDTHPSRQQKKDLATELGMDYKTVTIWFQNKRQTSKRGQLPVVTPNKSSERTRADSCLRTVSSPSHNATLDSDALGIDPTADSSESKCTSDGLSTITAKAIVKIKPLLDSLNALTSRPRGHADLTETTRDAPNVDDFDPCWSQALPGTLFTLAESNKQDQIAEQEKTKGKPIRWERIRTLEWACERQTKRRKLFREAYARPESEEVQDHSGPSDDTRMDSALSLLSLASSTQARTPKDVMRGASLLLSFKYSWRRKQQV